MRILFLLLVIYSPSLLSAAPVKTIHVVCDHWQSTCNKDGSGLYFDLIREVYALKNISMTYTIEPYKRALVSVSQGKADTTPGAFLTPERANSYLYPLIRITTEYTALLYLASHPLVNNPYNIAGTTVKIRGYDYRRYNNPKINMVEVSQSSQAIKMLMTKRADFFMNDYQDILTVIDAQKLNPADFHLTLFARDPTYLVFQKTLRGEYLRKVYDEGIAILYRNGRVKALVEQYGLNPIYGYYPELDNAASSSPP